MCDFRKIKTIKLHGTGQIVHIEETKNIHWSEMKNVKDPGLYHVAASGAFHEYFTGSEWLRESYHYEVLAYE